MSASLYGCRGVAHSSRAGAVSAISAQVHDRDGVGHVADDGEIVRDEEKPELELTREFHQEVRDLRLRRGVERSQRLVENDDGRARGERPGDGDALALATRELVRIAARGGFRKPYRFEELSDSARSLRSRGKIENRERVADLLADPPPRVERGERVLEDHLQPHLVMRTSAAGQRLDLSTLEADRPRARCHHPDRGARERGLAAAGLADETDDRPALHVEARAGDRANRWEPAPLVFHDDVGELESAQEGTPIRSGSTGHASARPFTGTSGGIASAHEGRAYPQRGWNAQPGGM